MSVGQEFWFVATGSTGGDKDGFFQQLKGQGAFSGKGGCAMKFDVPDGDAALRFGSFDSLIRLTDDLQKADAQIDSIVHRLERQYLEIEPSADFKIITTRPQRRETSLLDYLSTWQWDESRYPKSNSIGETLMSLMPKMAKLDEEARKKTAEYSDVKAQKANVTKKDGTLLTVDLVDTFTPQQVVARGSENDDFIYSKFLTTVVVILTKGSEKDFLACYEKLSPTVVPQSAKCFTALTDKDGNTAWRVVLCSGAEKNHIDNFKRACRERRFVARDFEYSGDAYKKLLQDRDRLEKEVIAQQRMVTDIYRNAWSDVMHVLVHVKAMRVFVESVLRYGMPPKFASFVVSAAANKGPLARKALASVLGKGAAMMGGDEKEADEDEFFPYVSLSFTPFTTARG